MVHCDEMLNLGSCFRVCIIDTFVIFSEHGSTQRQPLSILLPGIPFCFFEDFRIDFDDHAVAGFTTGAGIRV